MEGGNWRGYAHLKSHGWNSGEESGGGAKQTFRCKSYADCPIFLEYVMYNMISSVILGVIGHSGGEWRGAEQTFLCKSYADCPIFLGYVMYNMISSVILVVIGHSGVGEWRGSQASLTVSGSHRPLLGGEWREAEQTFRCKSYADCPIFLGYVMYNMISSVILGVIGHSGEESGGEPSKSNSFWES